MDPPVIATECTNMTREHVALNRMAASLGRLERIILVLRYADGLSAVEIGLVLGLRPDRVTAALTALRCRGREALRAAPTRGTAGTESGNQDAGRLPSNGI
jgi:DNA-directed RNA polymerase specialized sigma24 family protein